MSDFDPRAVRASEAARCYRMAAYRALGAPALERDDPQTEEYFYRGRVFEEIEVRRLEAKYGRENVLRQVEVNWGMGEPGHADAFVIPERALVEIKSTTTPTFSVPMVDMAIAQLRLYLRFFPEADHGLLELVDPNRLRPADVIVVRNTDEDVAAIDAAVDELRAAISGGALPARVCSRPSQARGRFCSFAATCFEGWEPEPPGEISDPDVVDAVADLLRLRLEMEPLKRQLALLEPEEKLARETVVQLVDEGNTKVGPYLVTRKHVKRAPTFQPKLAIAAGFPMQTLEEFFKPGAEYDTIRLGRADEPVDVDYGDEAPF